MHRLFLYLLLLVCSCKRDEDPVIPNNNEMNANVVLSSGNTILINARGSKAKISKDFYGITYISGVNENNEGVFLMFGTVTVPGVITYLCEYRVNVNSQTTPIYVNALPFVANSGNVIITAVSERHIEGTFTATCKTSAGAADSAVITGSFKGDY